MKKIFLFCAAMALGLQAYGQRQMDKLDRGLIAVKTDGGVYTGWRIDGTEYYDTQYNLYRDGIKVNAKPLNVSNYKDPNGTLSSIYTVCPVVKGVEQAESKPTKVWNRQYMQVPLASVYSRRGIDVTVQYEPNDVSTADLDGDGQYELIVKRINTQDARDLYPQQNDSAYCFFEAYKMDGTKLWTIDCGPNLVSSSEVELNIVAYDWDGDGKAELLMRAADGTILPGGVVIGDKTKNYRNSILHTANMTYMTTGDEFLLYMEGATGKLYHKQPFPLKRLEQGESNLEKAWGDGYGHRSNKFFFGAPILDGRKPSIFLARGIYTRHKMIAYDVNPTTHELTERWKWNATQGGTPWYGQGFHNYGIADVDLDGRDEIIYGSMVIDDNGQGLSTTGLGHGDAQHCSDLDPYRKGLELFTCLEGNPGACFRNAENGEIYYRYTQDRDCGRCMAGNFTDDYLGSQLVAGTNIASSVTDKVLANSWQGITQNFAIYWDGDLCRETMDYTNVKDVNNNGAGVPGIYKYGSNIPLFTATGSYTNNYTKGSPAVQCDLFGDWREEMVVRSDDNRSLRIYTTTDVTPWRNYTLLHDMQYRQSIVWQMCGYNQPPHVSYFLGKSEGITLAPPPLMNNGRVEVTDKITIAENAQHVLLSRPEGGTVTIENGAAPYILTINAYAHTEGHNDNEHITTRFSAYTLSGASLSGAMRLIKQGEGILNFTGKHTYSGATNLWGGITNFRGELTNSSVWMNRFAELNAAADFGKGITQEYGSVLRVGGANEKGKIKTDSLTLNYGAVIEFDVYSSDISADIIEISKELKIKQIEMKNGPQYNAPIFRFMRHNKTGENKMAPGKYLIIKTAKLEGDINSVIIQGMQGQNCQLTQEGNDIYLIVKAMRDAASIHWIGNARHGTWNLNDVKNFKNAETLVPFVTGDKVIFTDEALNYDVDITAEVMPDTVVFNANNNYILKGIGYIAGNGSLVKKGSGVLTITNTNQYRGNTILAGGITRVSALANALNSNGALGTFAASNQKIEIKNGAVLQNTQAVSNETPIVIGEGGGEINSGYLFEMKGAISGGEFTKTGLGTLRLYGSSSLKQTIINAGTLQMAVENASLGDTLFLNNAVYSDCDNMGSYSSNNQNFCVNKGKTGTIHLDSRCTYRGKLFGEGTLKVNVPNVRSQLQGDWSQFGGTVQPINASYGLTLDNAFGLPIGTLNIPSGIVVYNSGKTYKIGALTGDGTLGALSPWTSSGTNTWQVGSMNTDFSFSGKITGYGTAFVKMGTGVMKYSGNSDFTGTCTVLAGELCLNNRNTTKSMLGTGPLIVESGARLTGVGVINNMVTIKNNGLLRPGVTENSISGILNFGKQNVSLSVGSTLQLFIASASMYTQLSDIGILNLKGTIKVNLRSGTTLKAGDEFVLWTAQQYAKTSTPSFDLDTLGPNLEWDTTEISKGILRVKTSLATNAVSTHETVSCIVHHLDGTILDKFTCAYKDISQKVKMLPAAYSIVLVNVQFLDGKRIIKITR